MEKIYYLPEGRTEAEYAKMAETYRNKLSHAENTVMLRIYRFLVYLCENECKHAFVRLADLSGKIVPAKVIHEKYGSYWMLLDEGGNPTGVFLTFGDPEYLTFRGYQTFLIPGHACVRVIDDSVRIVEDFREDKSKEEILTVLR
jgi:hypothetical protein